MYVQRYIAHFPAAGEIVIFDRSWYNGAGVEHVMGFCTKEQHKRFLEVCPEFERHMVDNGIRLIKYWLEVSNKEQKRRFEARVEDPLRQWKLSDMDLPSRQRWYDYSRASGRDAGGNRRTIAPWYVEIERQEAGAAQRHIAFSQPDPLRGAEARQDQAADARQ